MVVTIGPFSTKEGNDKRGPKVQDKREAWSFPNVVMFWILLRVKAYDKISQVVKLLITITVDVNLPVFRK